MSTCVKWRENPMLKKEARSTSISNKEAILIRWLTSEWTHACTIRTYTRTYIRMILVLGVFFSSFHNVHEEEGCARGLLRTIEGSRLLIIVSVCFARTCHPTNHDSLHEAGLGRVVYRSMQCRGWRCALWKSASESKKLSQTHYLRHHYFRHHCLPKQFRAVQKWVVEVTDQSEWHPRTKSTHRPCILRGYHDDFGPQKDEHPPGLEARNSLDLNGCSIVNTSDEVAAIATRDNEFNPNRSSSDKRKNMSDTLQVHK